ncbi:MAG: 1-acyl-sn-glycerol-3-phosphate acyltransferase [Gammaproteobacteria bacterium]
MEGAQSATEQGSRPRRYAVRVLGRTFQAAVRCLYRVEVTGLENFSRAPSTLIVANHRDDADGPIISSVLVGKRDLTQPGVLPHFVAREDLCRHAFLRAYLDRWPWFLRAMLGLIDVRPLVAALQAHPMRRIRERAVGEVLEDVLEVFGDLPLEQVLKTRWAKRFEAFNGGKPLSVADALTRRYRRLYYERGGLSVLTLKRYRAIKPYQRAAIQQQLQTFVGLLEAGELVQLAPEGVISPDGTFARPRGALHTLVNTPRAPVRLLPVSITYDYMTTGRPRVFVNVGSEQTKLRGLSRRDTDRRVMELIVSEATVTVTHLASDSLRSMRVQGRSAFSARQLCSVVGDAAMRCAAAGYRVDAGLLDESSRWRRIGDYLDYCVRDGILAVNGQDRYHIVGLAVQRPLRSGWRDGGFWFAVQELQALLGSWRQDRATP